MTMGYSFGEKPRRPALFEGESIAHGSKANIDHPSHEQLFVGIEKDTEPSAFTKDPLDL
jgi:hypothetical protein